MADKRVRYENVTDKLQLVYTKQGKKREIIPGGTVLLDEEWAKRFKKVLRKKE